MNAKPFIFITIATCLFVTTTIAQAKSTTGLLITHDVKDNAYKKWFKAALPVLQARACEPLRKGELKGAQGPLPWNSVDHFQLFQCQIPVLDQLITNGLYTALTNLNKRASMVEGQLEIIADSAPPEFAEYVIKLSYRNNVYDARRIHNRNQIDVDAKKAGRAWINDAIFTPTASVGFIRPDDITFLYYINKKKGNDFRKNNPNIMQQINAFNQNHLTSFTYLFGSLNQ